MHEINAPYTNIEERYLHIFLLEKVYKYFNYSWGCDHK